MVWGYVFRAVSGPFRSFSVHFLRFRCSLCARVVRLAGLANGAYSLGQASGGGGGAQGIEKSKKYFKNKHFQNGVNLSLIHI